MKMQTKITSMFKRGKQIPDDIVVLQNEIEELEKKLKDKQNELFLIQRESFKQKVCQPKKKVNAFVRPEKIVLENSVASLHKDLELMGMLTGMEVTSFVAGDHCSVVYHMHHNSEHETKHGLRIELKHAMDRNTFTLRQLKTRKKDIALIQGINEISKSSLPLGFNLDAVIRAHDSVMKPECLRDIWNALAAYYNRLEQYEALKRLVNVEAQLFKVLDGSHMEITFAVQTADDDEEDPVTVMLVLDYDVGAVRPKNCKFKERDLTEEVVEILMQQCLVFQKKPLNIAFTEAFMEDFGRFRFVHQIGLRTIERNTRPRRRVRNKNNNNDDTFLPEDCSDMSEAEYYDDA